MFEPRKFSLSTSFSDHMMRHFVMSLCLISILCFGLAEPAYAQDTTDHILEPGESIDGTESITSQNDLYALDVDPINGDVFVSGPSGRVWTLSVGIENPGYDYTNMILHMQTDGDFSVSAPPDFDWATETASVENAGASLHLKNDGRLVIYRTDGVAVWESSSASPLLTIEDSAIATYDTDVKSVDWGDYDGDGDLDLLLTGIGLRPTVSEGAEYGVSEIYENTPTGLVLDQVASDTLIGANNGSAAWGDYDGDGDLDLLLTGNGLVFDDLEGSSAEQDFTHVYQNTGSGFTAIYTPTVVIDSAVAWGDYDNDGDLDFLLTGQSAGGKVSEVYENTGDRKSVV